MAVRVMDVRQTTFLDATATPYRRRFLAAGKRWN
jgi:hypothetical protein